MERHWLEEEEKEVMLTFVLTPSRPRGSSEEVRQGGSTVAAEGRPKSTQD